MNRRSFVINSILTTGGIKMLKTKANNSNNTIACKKKKPKQLLKGDTIAIISPGSHVNQEKLDKAITNIQSLGFKTILGKSINKKY
ncbi:MAG: hypothetical protein V3V14_05690 [Saprospiraceae bacterium]